MKVNQKEDHLAATNLEPDKTTISTKEIDQNLSHLELLDRINSFQKTAVMENELGDVSLLHVAKLEQMKNDYLKQVGTRERDELSRSKGYAQGIRSGLNHTHSDKLRSDREHEAQLLRNKVMQEARSYYDNHFSLSKDLNEKSSTPEKAEKLPDKTEGKTKTVETLKFTFEEYRQQTIQELQPDKDQQKGMER